MNNKIINISVLILVILANWFLFDLCLLAQGGSRFQGEIMCEVEGLLGEERWEVIAICTSPIRWNGDYFITSDYQYVSIYGKGNAVSFGGFHSPDDPVGQADLAYGEYEFTFDFPYPYSDVSFTLDLRDAEWSTQYPDPHDIFIKCNANNGILKKKLGAGGTYTTLNEISIWAIYGLSDPFNQAAFQPTTPQSFCCANPEEIGHNPIFVWLPSAHVNPALVKYKIFQNIYVGKFIIGTYLVAQNLTDCSWKDTGVVIDPNGTHFSYYVIAYTGQSPDSDPSNLAHIRGNPYKALANAPEKDSLKLEMDQNTAAFELSAFPNPFNPSTTIQYALPTASHVMLKVFNLRSELVKTLVDGFRTANRYQVVWNGENEAGAKVASGIYLYQLQTDNYSQIKRMIFIK